MCARLPELVDVIFLRGPPPPYPHAATPSAVAEHCCAGAGSGATASPSPEGATPGSTCCSPTGGASSAWTMWAGAALVTSRTCRSSTWPPTGPCGPLMTRAFLPNEASFLFRSPARGSPSAPLPRRPRPATYAPKTAIGRFPPAFPHRLPPFFFPHRLGRPFDFNTPPPRCATVEQPNTRTAHPVC